jgi:hypothetical protein
VPKTGSIYVCTNGEHAICADCFILKKKCDNPSKGLEQLRNKLPLSCKNRKNGCKTVLTLDSMLFHEAECEWRPIFCPVLFCYDKSDIFTMHAPHLTDFESDLVDQKQSFFEKVFLLKKNKGLLQDYGCWSDPNRFSLKKGQFFFKMVLDRGLFYFWVYYCGSSEEAKNYNCTIEVFNGDQKFSYIVWQKTLTPFLMHNFFQKFSS